MTTESDSHDACEVRVAEQETPTEGDSVLRELAGVVLSVIFLAVVIVVLSWMISFVSASLEKSKAAAEASRAVEAVDIVAQEIKPQAVSDTIVLPGRVEPWEFAYLSAQVDGRLIASDEEGVPLPLAEGSPIQPQEPILMIDPSDYRIALTKAKAQLDLVEESLKRATRLRENKVNSLAALQGAQAAYDQAKASVETAELNLERCLIRSPIEGVVERIYPEVGELVSSSDRVAHVVNTNVLKVEVGVPEKDVEAVRDVSSCTVRIEALGNEFSTSGEPVFLSYTPMENSQVYLLRLKVENPDGKIRPGMFANVDVVRAVHENSVMVPYFAVLAKDGQHYAFVLVPYDGVRAEGGRAAQRDLAVAERRVVKLGVIDGNDVQIVEGLQPGDRLIISGHRSVEDGSVVNVTRVVGAVKELVE